MLKKRIPDKTIWIYKNNPGCTNEEIINAIFVLKCIYFLFKINPELF